MRKSLLVAITVGVAAGWMYSTSSSLPVAQSQEGKPAKASPKTDLDTLQVNAEQFEAAFNKGDAAAIAAQFTENGEIVDEDGNVVKGKADIQARFAELFKDYPKAKVRVEVTSVRQLSPDVAVEDGFSATTLDPDEPEGLTPYTIVHVKRDGKWFVASVRDFPEETTATAHHHLQSLAWLVGDWVDQSGDAQVKTSCKWSEDGNYLIQEFDIKLRGGQEGSGTQRIGWDPVRKTIRGWAFDHSGGYGESTWTEVEGGWIIKAEGYTPDGRTASAIRHITPLGQDLFQLDTTHRLVGHEELPNAMVRVARRPPAPVSESRSDTGR